MAQLSEDEVKGASCLLSMVLTFAALPFYAVLLGFTFATLWRWFVVPSLGVQPIGILYAIGLSLTIRLLTFSYTKSDPNEDMLKDTINRIVFAVIYCGLSLGEGWIILKLIG